MSQTILRPVPSNTLESVDNATRTSDYAINDEAREAYAAAFVAALDRADDMVIALELRAAAQSKPDDQIEIEDFIREQGYEPRDFGR